MKRHIHLSELFFGNIRRLRSVVITLALSVGLLMSLLISQANAYQQDRPYRTETFSVSGNVDLEVETSGGSIEVHGSHNNEVVVEMYVRKRGRWMSSDNVDLSDYQITIDQQGSTIHATAKRINKRLWNSDNISIAFKVRTPSETSSDLSTSGGSIRIAQLEGIQELRTSGGSINILDVMGNIDARTSGGSIKVKNVEGDLKAKTSGGSIRLARVEGDLDFSTSGGSLQLNDVSGQVNGSTSGGSIRANISAVTGDIRLSTSGGSIYASVPGNQGYNLDLRGNRVHTQLVNFTGDAEDDKIKGQMNGGGSLLALKTSGGQVRLKYE